MDKVNTPVRPQGHKVKNEITKVIAVFSPFLRTFANSYSFEVRNLIPSKYNQLTMTKKFMDQNFDSGPRFWAMAQRAQNGPRFENRTHPSVLEPELCKFQNVLA